MIIKNGINLLRWDRRHVRPILIIGQRWWRLRFIHGMRRGHSSIWLPDINTDFPAYASACLAYLLFAVIVLHKKTTWPVNPHVGPTNRTHSHLKKLFSGKELFVPNLTNNYINIIHLKLWIFFLETWLMYCLKLVVTFIIYYHDYCYPLYCSFSLPRYSTSLTNVFFNQINLLLSSRSFFALFNNTFQYPAKTTSLPYSPLFVYHFSHHVSYYIFLF